MTRIAQRQMAQFPMVIETAQPSRARLEAWPTLGKAAAMISTLPSTLTRAADSQGIVKYPFGRRDKKLAPDAVLDLALVYGADVNEVAEQLMVYAEASGTEQRYVDDVEATIGAWMAGQAHKARSEPGELDAIVAAVRELAAPEVAEAILARAGVTD